MRKRHANKQRSRGPEIDRAKEKRILITAPFVLVFLIAGFFLLQPKGKDDQAKKVITLINAYYREHGVLPPKLETIGVKETMEGPIFYQKENDTESTVWYGTTLGESKIYRLKDGIMIFTYA